MHNSKSSREPSMNEPTGIVFDIQRGALHDGPGVRTTVFLKGCPLRCVWCHNPESQARAPETGRSGKVYGRTMSVSEVMAVVRRDLAYYQTSNGGLTISGGEPTFQAEFCVALLRAAKAEGIHTCLDTSGFFSAAVRETVRPLTDLFLFDYKATGAARHRELTGVSQDPIGENLRLLLEGGAVVWLRCPVVPTLNDQPEHWSAITELRHRFPGIERVDLLPYHRSGRSKWHDLDREPLSDAIKEPDDSTRQLWTELLECQK